MSGAEFLERSEIVQNSGRGFAMRTPKPLRRGLLIEASADGVEVQRLSPFKFQSVELELRPPRLVHQAVTEFAVAQDETALVQQ